VTGSAIHVSDLHRGATRADAVDNALAALVSELSPTLVIATGDLANRGRRRELEGARAMLDRLAAPLLAVPGNHDIPYAVPRRFTSPWREFERAFGGTAPVFRSETLVACGLNSARPWRQQGGRLSMPALVRAREELADAPAGALRVVAFHHHLAGAPWRAARKRPLRRRDAVLDTLAQAGAELVVGGHIHQSAAVERREFAIVGPDARPLVLATAPGLSRPRPRRSGEAQGLHVYRWDADSLSVETWIWDGKAFAHTATRAFRRGT
jgi:3',5'-cyclic AMP phosphodiesterase CpdA